MYAPYRLFSSEREGKFETLVRLTDLFETRPSICA